MRPRPGPVRRAAVIYDCLYPIDTGGGERVYRALAERLADRDIQVDYLTRLQWDEREVPEAGFAIRGIWRGEIADAAGNRLPRAAIGFARAIHRELRRTRGRYELVVVSALPPLNVLAARLALLGSRTRLVADWLEVWPLRKWHEYSGRVVGTIAWMLQWVGLRSSDDITVNSSFTLRRARRRPDDGMVLGLVDLVGEGPAAPAAEVDSGLLLFVGRHIPDKRLPALAGALAVVRRTRPDARLIVAGSGPETGALREAARRAGVEVEVVGRVPDAELDELMARAAVLVNPSRREGFGLVVAEAAAHGTPSVVVADEDNAAADLVAEGVNGFLAASAGAEQLGAAIVRALDGGAPLRSTTKAWFDEARRTRNLRASVEELLSRYERASTD